MDIRRVILYGALALVLYSLWTAWQRDYQVPSVPVHDAAITADKERLLPPVAGHGIPAEETVNEQPQYANDKEIAAEKADNLISVETDVLKLKIDTEHGDIVSALLLDYPVSVEQKDKPFALLQNKRGERYVANSSLFTVKDQAISNVDFHFQSRMQSYQLEPGQKKLVVTLEGDSPEGLRAKKEFIFTEGSYLIEMRYELTNTGEKPWVGYLNTQLLRSSPAEDKSSIFHIGSYTGASYSNPGQHRYQKVSFQNMQKANLDVQANGGWVAMQQHYFLSAWVPPAESKNRFYTRTFDGTYTIGAVSQPIRVMPEKKEVVGSRLYVGPEITSVLQSIAPGLDLTVDYGWLWFLSSLLFSLMKAIHSLVGNWGWSIVLVTVLIKLAFYRLSATSYKSMAAMRKLQPKLQELRERYGDDKAKMSQATMELYRKEKVNPLGGCLPILIQIPVFIALYWVLLESVELRQAPFILWINDLASADPYHVLPIIMGATMLIQQKLNPAPPDPTQAKVMMFLPILFTALFWSFPAGLVLYWIVNNTLSILQQWYITRKYSDDKPVKKLAPAK
ncbi:membrane protein insertase YidC [Legionella londiniensis]|uniref:Membrane protein insertase YidC n=1 Tax=Legionella londiniensis TaxID=45068 RepID=A0A0W0VNL5_9GAMM|nr:membrane protein insertase YidC [Legionella londiniensis]KTD21760.1 preprotein translocase subunit YidC [Legionella londiniensis]STX94369.1 preprotein translocase YidC subunit [Legionella londiniensis]